MKEILLINVSGDDKPGVTSAITAVLAQHQATILDIGQVVIHDTLALGILVALEVDANTKAVILDEIHARTQPLSIQVRFQPVSLESYQHWVDQ